MPNLLVVVLFPPLLIVLHSAPRSRGGASHRIAAETSAALAWRSADALDARPGRRRSRRTPEGLPGARRRSGADPTRCGRHGIGRRMPPPLENHVFRPPSTSRAGARSFGRRWTSLSSRTLTVCLVVSTSLVVELRRVDGHVALFRSANFYRPSPCDQPHRRTSAGIHDRGGVRCTQRPDAYASSRRESAPAKDTPHRGSKNVAGHPDNWSDPRENRAMTTFCAQASVQLGPPAVNSPEVLRAQSEPWTVVMH